MFDQVRFVTVYSLLASSSLVESIHYGIEHQVKQWERYFHIVTLYNSRSHSVLYGSIGIVLGSVLWSGLVYDTDKHYGAS
jgi:hypothetical protein